MKGVLYMTITGTILFGLIGCHTVPRHLSKEVVVIYYYEPIEYYEPPDPLPVPDPPYSPVIRPELKNPTPPRDRQSVKPKDDGNSYGQRDPLQGGDKRGRGEIKSDPPVKKPPKNDRVQ